MSKTIYQQGVGDNYAGDDVHGDKIKTQINNSQDLTQAAEDIKALLDELSEEYNPTTEKGQAKIKAEAIEQIKQNPMLKQRTTKSLETDGEEALNHAIQHSVARIVVSALKEWLLPE